jgi:hypothetical protein
LIFISGKPQFVVITCYNNELQRSKNQKAACYKHHRLAHYPDEPALHELFHVFLSLAIPDNGRLSFLGSMCSAVPFMHPLLRMHKGVFIVLIARENPAFFLICLIHLFRVGEGIDSVS